MKKILVIITYLLIANFAMAGEKSWSWVECYPRMGQWDPMVGVAEVNIEGNRFSAHLYDEIDQDFLRISIEGTINSDNITAKYLKYGTEGDAVVIKGKYHKEIWAEPFNKAIGVETIMFPDNLGLVGLTREIKELVKDNGKIQPRRVETDSAAKPLRRSP